MRRLILGMCISVVALSMAVKAQDSKMTDMSKTHKMDDMAREHGYTGCVERAAGGDYSLAHVASADAMKQKPMKADPMSKTSTSDTMAKDSMAKDSMTKDSMAKDSMTSGAMMHEAPSTLKLSSVTIDLSRHVGHKVSITGTEGDAMGSAPMFTVKSLKMIAKSCS